MTTAFLPIPCPRAAKTMFGSDIVTSLAFSANSSRTFDLKQLIAMISYPIFMKSGMIVNSCIIPSSTSLFRLLVMVGCDTRRTFANSLSLRLESFNNSKRSFFVSFFFILNHSQFRQFIEFLV